MATNTAIAIKQHKAHEKLERAARRIGRVVGLEAPDLNPRARQPGMIEAMRTEALADYLTKVAEAVYQMNKTIEESAPADESATETPETPETPADAEKTVTEAPEPPKVTKDTTTPKRGR